jgi:hypothetical protein
VSSAAAPIARRPHRPDTAEREELARLRKEESRAADAARHPKKAAAFFAKHQQ